MTGTLASRQISGRRGEARAVVKPVLSRRFAWHDGGFATSQTRAPRTARG